MSKRLPYLVKTKYDLLEKRNWNNNEAPRWQYYWKDKSTARANINSRKTVLFSTYTGFILLMITRPFLLWPFLVKAITVQISQLRLIAIYKMTDAVIRIDCNRNLTILLRLIDQLNHD